MDLVILEAIQHGTARFLQLLRPVDIVLFVKAGAQLHQRHNFLAIFGCFHQGLYDLGLPRHPVQGHLDGDASGSCAAFFSIAIKGRMDWYG